MTIKATFDGSAIRPDEPDKLRQYKRSLNEGAVLAMTFEPWSERRHRGQQGLFHALIGRYANAKKNVGMSESREHVKLRIKHDLGNYLYASKILDGTHRPNYRGKFIDLNEIYPKLYSPDTIVFMRSESDYTVQMESEAIEYVINMCEHNGVRTDDIREEYEG